MCGIAGFIGSKKFLPSKKTIDSCLELMKERGPDYQSYKKDNFFNNTLLFLFSRLSIIDISKKSNLKKIVDGMTPGDLRENDTFIVPFGLGCLTYAHILRSGNFFNKNYAFYSIENSITTLEVRDEKSFQNLIKLTNLN